MTPPSRNPSGPAPARQSASSASLCPSRTSQRRQQRDALDVRRVREHVHRGHLPERVAVLADQHLEVARERRRVARDVDEPRRAGLPDALQRLAGEPGTRRIDDDDVRLARPRAQLLERLADVPGEERRVRDPVQIGVLDRAGDRLLRDLDPPHRERVRAPSRGPSCRCRSTGRRPSPRRSARPPRSRAGRASRPSRCSSAGTRSAARGSGGRAAPPRSPPRPRAGARAGS